MATVSDETLRALIAELEAGRSAGITPGPDATSTEKMEAAMKNIKSDAKAIGDLFGTYADSLMGGSREFDLIAKSTLNVGTNIVRMTNEIKTFESAVEAAGMAVKGLFSLFTGGLFGAVFKAISAIVGVLQEFIGGFDSFQKVASKTIGATRDLRGRFLSLRRELNLAKLGFAGFEERLMSFQSKLPGFAGETTKLTDEFAKQIEALNRFGFSATQQAEAMGTSMRVFGDSADAAAQRNRMFVNLGNTLGMTGDQISSGFQSATKSLGQFGRNVLESFPKLQAVAKKTGASLDSMFGIVNKFNTFEDAASMVGKLNAILGGPFLDSIELLQKDDPAEIIEEIAGAFDAAGVDFQRSGRHMKHAISSILGVSADEAARLLSEGGDAFGAAQITVEDAARITARSTQDLLASAKMTMDLQERATAEMKLVAEKVDGAMGNISSNLNNFAHNFVKRTGNILSNMVTNLSPLLTTFGAAILTSTQSVLKSMDYLIVQSSEVMKYFKKEFMGEDTSGEMTLGDIYGAFMNPTQNESDARAFATGVGLYAGSVVPGVGTVTGGAVAYGGTLLAQAKMRAAERATPVAPGEMVTPITPPGLYDGSHLPGEAYNALTSAIEKLIESNEKPKVVTMKGLEKGVIETGNRYRR
tara:strand:+ start:7425 stop:9353 length:1929 start_codon:yes stop_codon:yes gene_type:complete